MVKMLNGKDAKEYFLNNIKNKISALDKNLKLVVIRVGEDSSSIIYVNSKRKACVENNIMFEELHFDDTISEKDLINQVYLLNNDENVTSILVQLPLPSHINANNVINSIDYRKDVDGLTNINIGKLMNNENGIEGCTAKGIINLLKYYHIEIAGKNIVIINRSKLVGRPLIPLLLKEDATLTICHSKTANLKLYTKNADIIIVAVGKPNFLTSDMIGENCTVIDVGINKVNGKIVGDSSKNIYDIAKAISPVPGGVGLMTISSVVLNVLECYNLQKK